MIAHPLLREINTTAVSMRQVIKESAVLLRNGKDRVEASDVSFIETNEAIVRFFFPRQQAIQAGGKEVIFRFEMLDTLVEAKFSLKEMVYRGQPARAPLNLKLSRSRPAVKAKILVAPCFLSLAASFSETPGVYQQDVFCTGRI
jgi:hypothetical protein